MGDVRWSQLLPLLMDEKGGYQDAQAAISAGTGPETHIANIMNGYTLPLFLSTGRLSAQRGRKRNRWRGVGARGRCGIEFANGRIWGINWSESELSGLLPALPLPCRSLVCPAHRHRRRTRPARRRVWRPRPTYSS